MCSVWNVERSIDRYADVYNSIVKRWDTAMQCNVVFTRESDHLSNHLNQLEVCPLIESDENLVPIWIIQGHLHLSDN